MTRTRAHWRAAALLAGSVLTTALAGCGGAATTPRPGTIAVLAAENEYGNVAGQIGGSYVTVTSVESNPNTDPHTYEVSPQVAGEVASAQVVIQNGVGYDDFMSKLETASPNSGRTVLNVQQLLRLPDSTPNPHLWYNPETMPAVANQLAADFSHIQPSHAAYFRANAATFLTSLKPWLTAIATFRASHPNTAVATTEPVGDYMLEAAGTNNLTPWSLQADIMNGVDPSPQDVATQAALFSQHRVRVFVYNQQVTDSLTQSFISEAQAAHIPVVGVYETMPTPGYSYQSWMLAEVNALQLAVTTGQSTQHL